MADRIERMVEYMKLKKSSEKMVDINGFSYTIMQYIQSADKSIEI